MTLYCHREFNSITCVYGYLGTDHSYVHVINGTITIRSRLDNCKVCQKEVDKREFYDLRQQKMKTDTLSLRKVRVSSYL